MNPFASWTPAKIAEHNANLARSRQQYERRMSGSFNQCQQVVKAMLSEPDKPVAFITRMVHNPVREPLLANCQREVKRFIVKIAPMGAVRMNRSVAWKPTEAALRYRVYKEKLKAAVGAQPVPDEVNWVAYLPMPESWSKKKKAARTGKPHRQRYDRDNIDKGICDALFPEDCAIWSGSQRKFWCQQGEERIELELVYYYEK